MRPLPQPALLALLLALLSTGCASRLPEREDEARAAPVVVPAGPGAPLESGAFKPGKDSGPAPHEIPPGLDRLPEPVPRPEPKSASGNPKSYVVFGKRYHVLDSARGYREVGIASWYGKKFHGRRTSSGEAYDMYALSAAHKTLPLPSYVRVTHLANGKSVVVRVNDRGPFHDGRIIDLSYAAATRIGLQGGTGPVEVEALDPGAVPPPRSVDPVLAATPEAARYLQAGAFSDPIAAVSLREDLQRLDLASITIHSDQIDGLPVHRVVLGPFASQEALLAARSRLEAAGHSVNPAVLP